MFHIPIKKKTISTIIGGLLCASQAHSADFYFGGNDDILLQLNSQLSIGASWRLNEADPRFISTTNGGEGWGATTDDGNLNFEKGETYSKIIKGLHDIQLTKDNYGAFVRFKYWYDKELKDENRAHGHSPNAYAVNSPLNDDGFSDFAKFSGIELLDAYIFTSFDLGNVPVDLRLGRQVLSWGESTFIQGGINSINPFDVSAFRRPGAELKEGLLPVGMIYANLGLTDNLSLEAFYQYEWEKTQIDGCGTYFSTSDVAADSCYAITLLGSDSQAIASGAYVGRESDIEPDDGGQYGLALRYYAEQLNETEFGFYYMNIHSRTPVLNGKRSEWKGINPALPLFLPHANALQLNAAYPQLAGAFAAGLLPADKLGQLGLASVLQQTGVGLEKINSLNPNYEMEYIEDLKIFGLSFATNLGGWAVSGEVSYKPDTPIQINGPEIINALVSESPLLRFTPKLLTVGNGETVNGYDEFDVTQFQATAVHFFERVLGASRLSLVGEVGAILTKDIEESNQHYGRNAVFGLGNFDAGFNHPVAGFRMNCENLVAAGQLKGDCSDDGFVTDSAWGYRLRAALEYSNVFAGVSLKPTLAWSHDVSGYSPEPGQQFHEGRKTVGLSLEASYQQRYSATIGYVSFNGGSHNTLEDKDFMSLSFNVSY
jgi:hypothetical protein